jgi:hypothetical protein
MSISKYPPPEQTKVFEPKVGDEITFGKSAFNRATIYTITEVNYSEVIVSTSTHPYSDRVFTYRLDRCTFDALEPRTLEAASW